MKAQYVLFWFTVVHSKSKFFTSITFYDEVSFGMMTEELKSILALHLLLFTMRFHLA